MSLPLNYKKGDYPPTIKKCVHSVYISESKSTFARNCDGCRNEQLRLEKAKSIGAENGLSQSPLN